MTATQEQWVNIDPIRIVWEDPGYVVEGEFVSVSDVQLPSGPAQRYVVQPEDQGAQPLYFYGTVILNDLMSSVAPGEVIKLVYEGIDESGKRPIKRFTLQRRLQI